MGLFGSKPVAEKTLRECEKLVEEFFRQVGLNPNEQRVEGQKGAWWAMRGSAVVYIFVNEAQDMNTLRIASPILYLPHENLLPFYRACLELNYSLVNCAMAIYKDILYLITERPLLGLDPEELQDTMNILGFYADKYDNELADEFGAKIYSEQVQGVKIS